MALSRMTAALLLAAQASAAPAQPVTAERAMEKYRETFQPPAALDCPKAPEGEIVVCGRRNDDRNRLPLPLAPNEGEVIRNDTPSSASLIPNCTVACPPEGGVNLDDVKMVVGAVGRLLEGDD